MPVVDAQKLCRSYGTHVVLNAVDVTIRTGERVGLVGDNGCGKSTLGRLLAGLESADTGEVHTRRGARVAYLAQAPDVDPALCAREAAISGLPGWLEAKQRYDNASDAMGEEGADLDKLLTEQAKAGADIEHRGGWDVTHRADAMLGHLGVPDPERPVGQMSGGEQRRVALAKVLLSQPDFAVLDEPTNHLDVETIEWLEKYLINNFSGAVLLVTHDRYVLDRVAQRTLEICEGELYSYDGGYGTFLLAKSERQAHEARAEQNRQNFLRREIEWLRRGPKARSTKQKARVDRAHDAIAVAAPKAEKTFQFDMAESRSGKTILEFHKVCLEQGGRVLIEGLDMFITKGERIGVLGPNGAGKTTLLKAVLGEHPCASGRIVVGKNVDVAYLSQGRDGLDLDASILENVSGGRLVVEYDGRDIDVRGYLQRFYFDAQRQGQPVGSLSGGERTRVALAKLLCHEANLIILDEPTNDLDVSTLSSLEEMLCGFAGTALIVTHDRYFMDRVATSVLATDGTSRWTRYSGNYADYLAQRPRPSKVVAGKSASNRSAANKSEAPRAGAISSGGEASTKSDKAKSNLTYGERLELQALPGKIEVAEAEVSELEAKLADPDLYKDRGDEVAGLQANLSKIQENAMTLMERWEALELKSEGGVPS